MRVVLIGCVDFSCAMFEQLLTLPEVEVVGVVTRRSSSFNADFCSLEPLATERGIPTWVDVGNQQPQMAEWIRTRSPDVVCCFGWPYLLSAEILNASPFGVVGYHPSELPRNRGRHPIIWALALGLSRTASSFFRMDEGADSGDLLAQEILELHPDEDAGSLYGRLTQTAARQLGPMITAIATGSIVPEPQDHTLANYWRKRSKEDGRIDWRMGSTTVHDLVRALARPYPGAHVVLDDTDYPVWRTRVADDEYPRERIANLEPGRILGRDGSTVDVRCGVGAIRLLEHTLPSTSVERGWL